MSEDKEKLSVDMIEELAKDFEEKKDVRIFVETKDGMKETTVTIAKRFHSTQIAECIREYIKKLDYIRLYVKNENKLKDVLQTYLIFLVVRHFSSLEIPLQFKRQVAILEKMIDTQVLMQIFAQFETSEVEKVMRELAVTTKRANKNLNNMEDKLQELSQMHEKSMKDIAKNLKKK